MEIRIVDQAATDAAEKPVGIPPALSQDERMNPMKAIDAQLKGYFEAVSAIRRGVELSVHHRCLVSIATTCEFPPLRVKAGEAAMVLSSHGFIDGKALDLGAC